MKPHLESEPAAALGILLCVVIGLVVIGKLTAEAVEAIKWVGGTYFAGHGLKHFALGNGDQEPETPPSKEEG